MNPFNKKSQPEDFSQGSQASFNDISVPPTDSVIAMQNQGLSNNQIIEYLQRQGYAPEQVFEAMNQANVKGGIENNFSQGNSFLPNQMSNPPMPSQGMGYSNDNEHIERVAEAIIEEKWNELSKHISKIVEWKDKTEAKINKIEQEFVDMKKNFDSLHSSILGKVSEYDQNIVNIGVEIKAMEKVFQKILPTLTDSVNELSRISKTIKEK
jgi:hypothetical protein